MAFESSDGVAFVDPGRVARLDVVALGFLGIDFFTGGFLAAVLFAGEFLAVVFFTGTFFDTGAFLAVAFLAAAFLTGGFLAVVFFTGTFFDTGAFLVVVLLAAVLFAGAFFGAFSLAGVFLAVGFFGADFDDVDLRAEAFLVEVVFLAAAICIPPGGVSAGLYRNASLRGTLSMTIRRYCVQYLTYG